MVCLRLLWALWTELAMNNGIPLDLLKIIERLEGGGVPHEQAKVLADVISAERKWADARYLPREELAHALWPIKSSIDKVDATVDRLATENKATADRLEMKIDKSAAEVKIEIMRRTVALWFLQVGFVTALVFKLIE